MLSPGAYEDRRRQQARMLALRIGTAVAFGLLAIVFWTLQIVEHDRYQEMADSNHLKTIDLRAPRGVLYDRNQKVLVENTYSFTIAVVRELSPRPDHDVEETVRRLAEATGIDNARAQDEVRRHKHEALFRPIPLIEHATMAQVASVMARKLEMPEVVVEQEPTRTYPGGGLAAHLFGYVGEIQDAQLDRPEYVGLLSGAIVGQTGLEKSYNADLMGEDGKREVAVNSSGREIQEVGEEDPPVDGDRMELTIDYDLQRALEDAFEAGGYSGAAVLLDPHSGEVLGMTSQPEFDPNRFANGVDRATWAALNSDPQHPLEDRPLQGRYSPGSTFKIVMSIAALSEGLITPDYQVTCPGSITIYGHVYHCDKKEGHGTLDLRHALEQSCDVYFYKLASMMPIDLIHAYADKLGLVGRTGIDLPGELENIMPSTEWKLRTTGEKWYAGETISVGIGQGPVTVTPISLSTMIAAIANGGTVVTPHVVKAIDDGHGWTAVPAHPPRSIFPIKPEVIEPVRDGLWLAVNSGNGTGVAAAIAGRDVMGKTGTAQVISTEGAKALRGTGVNTRDNSWFVFYAPRENPEIAGVIFAEHAGFGADVAAPIARYVLDTYFAKKDGRTLPTVAAGRDGGIVIK